MRNELFAELKNRKQRWIDTVAQIAIDVASGGSPDPDDIMEAVERSGFTLDNFQEEVQRHERRLESEQRAAKLPDAEREIVRLTAIVESMDKAFADQQAEYQRRRHAVQEQIDGQREIVRTAKTAKRHLQAANV